MDEMLLEFEEINSSINNYLNNLESKDDKELAPRKKVHNDNIKPPTPNPKRVTFDKEPNVIYYTNPTSGAGALEDAKYFISTGKKSNKKNHSQQQHPEKWLPNVCMAFLDKLRR